jgi:hypothetical protein
MDGSVMDGSSADDFGMTDRLSWIALLRRHFESWGLTDEHLSRAAAERVMAAVHRDGAAVGSVDPLQLATRWIRTMAEDGSSDSAEWFFRAPALLARFPAAFLETDIPDSHCDGAIDFLPELSPRLMPEQEVIGPITHAVRVAAEAMGEAMEGAMESVAAQGTGDGTRFPGGS